MSYIRKSFQERHAAYLQEQRNPHGLAHTYTHQHKPEYNRGRYSSNQKKYDYQSQINDSRQVRPRTPSASQFNKYKHEGSIINANTQPEFSSGVSHGKLKRIAKNYATGLGNTNYGDLNMHEKNINRGKFINIKDQSTSSQVEVERKQNINTKNNQSKNKSYSRKRCDQEGVKDSFERINEQKILQKISRINKLNSEINGRLQKILAKVSTQE